MIAPKNPPFKPLSKPQSNFPDILYNKIYNFVVFLFGGVILYAYLYREFKKKDIMTLEQILTLAKKASKQRGYEMYIIYDSINREYSFTQEKGLFLYDGMSFVYIVDGENVYDFL